MVRLIQIGNSPFYRTPDDPADPRDCERYPSSPWCGSNPFDRKTGVGFKPEIGYDGCNISLGITPILGHVALPRYELVYRQQWCRNPPPPPEPIPDGDTTKYYDKLPDWTDKYDDDETVLLGYACISYQGIVNASSIRGSTKEVLILEDVEFPSEGNLTNYNPPKVRLAKITQRIIRTNSGQVFNENLADVPDEAEDPYGRGFGWIDNISKIQKTTTTALGIRTGEDGRVIYAQTLDEETKQFPAWAGILDQQVGSGWYRAPIGELRNRQWTKSNFRIEQDGQVQIKRTYDFIYCNELPPPINNPLPPPLPPPEHCDCMGCCPTTNNNNSVNDDLIRRLLALVGNPTSATIFDSDENKPEAQASSIKLQTLFQSHQAAINRVEKISKIIGIDAFPIEMPDSVVKPAKTGIFAELAKFFKWDEKRRIKSIAELMIWLVEQDSATMGQWHQIIEIEDDDLTKKGKQTKKVVLPNVAETLKEVILLLIELTKTAELALDVNLKNLTETTATHLDAAKAKFIIEDIQQFLDYQTQQLTKEVPTQISIPSKDLTSEEQENVYRYLAPSMQKVVYDDWNGKRSLNDILLDLLQVGAIVRATGYQQVNKP